MESINEKIFWALNDLPALNERENRDLLLRGLPFAGSLHRSTAKLADLAQIVEQALAAGKLKNTDQYAIEVVLKYAIKLVEGTERAAELEKLRSEFLADPDAASAALSNLLPDRMGGRPLTEPQSEQCVQAIQIDGGLVRWIGMPIDALVPHCWGSISGGLGARVRIRLDTSYEAAEALSLSLFRLAIHGGVRRFEVPESHRWKNLCRSAAENCLGTRDKFWPPSDALSTHSESWNFAELRSEAVGDNSSTSHSVTAPESGAEIAQRLDDAMDQWVIKRLNGLLARIMRGDSIDIISTKIHPDYLVKFQEIWPQWYLTVQANPKILKPFLSYMMSTSESMPKQLEVGSLRVGPRTVEACLLPAVVFALSVESAIESNLTPTLDTEPTNFKLKREGAQLVGLELVKGKSFDQALQQLQWRTGYVLLTHEQTPIAELKQYRSIRACQDHVKRFTQTSANTSTIITQESHIRRLIQNEPPSKLREYLESKVVELNMQMQIGIRNVIGERTIGGAA